MQPPRKRSRRSSVAMFLLGSVALAACASGAGVSGDDSAGDTGGGAGDGGNGGITWNPAVGAGGHLAHGGTPSAGGTGGARPGTGGSTIGFPTGGGSAGDTGAGGAIGAGGSPHPGGCGDGIKTASEQCDTKDFGGATCATVLSNPNIAGLLKCSPACQIDTTGCKANPTCGDGVINQMSEACDGGDFGLATCASVTGNANATGALSCSSACVISSASCKMGAFCGDGKKDPAEDCDGIDLGMASCATVTGNPAEGGELLCSAQCTFDKSKCSLTATCGDGSKNQMTEQCDGVDLNGATCQSLLGNAHAVGSVTCSAQCAFVTAGCSVPPYCGDSIKNGNESCDGPDLGTQTCASILGVGHGGALVCAPDCTVGTGNCTTVAVCGDGQKNQPSEQCDGGDVAGATCAGLVGNGSTGNVACFANCLFNTGGCSPPVLCGNGSIDAGEQCDGANLNGQSCSVALGGNPHAVGNVSCTGACTIDSSGCSIAPYCGDGHLGAGEECDDGNGNDGDGCSSACVVTCFSGELKYGTNCYSEFQSSVSWDQASANCQALGGHLATIGDSGENSFIWDAMNGGTTAARWIGLNDKGSVGTFTWITGEAVTYLDWASGEPNNIGSEDCVEFYYLTIDWNNNSCSQSRWYWCEYEPIVANP